MPDSALDRTAGLVIDASGTQSTLPAGEVRRIAIISDAWMPQVNGVVRTIATLTRELRAMGHVVEVIAPDRFRTVPCPTYPDIRLALKPFRRLRRDIEAFAPDHIHIATEGPLGIAGARLARRRGWQFTTCFATKFPDYIAARTGLPASWFYAWLRRFHNRGFGTMVATASLGNELQGRGFREVRPWTRGVDLAAFTPDVADGKDMYPGLARPIFAYVGRVAVEKNIEAFLRLDLPGSKVVVGDGPQRAGLEKAYPGVHFTGARFGAELAASYAAADVFVFPSLTDTFGLVLLEALACGTPVAAYPVTGPRDVLANPAGHIGAMDDDLRAACLAALAGDQLACRAHAERFSWRACAELFLQNLVRLREA